jgi:hypothetical protein
VSALLKAATNGTILETMTYLGNAASTTAPEFNAAASVTPPYLYTNAVTELAFWGPAVKDREYDIISYTPSTQDARMPSSAYTMNNNQWCHVVDTETFGRRGFLNGVSTLSGSIFYQMNVVSPVADIAHIVNFYSFFDAILVMDYTTKQVSWKI